MTRDQRQAARSLVEGLDREQVHLLAETADLRAVVLEQVDRDHPSPEMRNDAHQLRQVRDLLRQANVARDLLEGRE